MSESVKMDMDNFCRIAYEIMYEMGISIRGSHKDGKFPSLQIDARVGKIAEFKSGDGYYHHVIGNHKIVSGYESPKILLSKVGYDVLYTIPNASLKHKYKSILVHEFVHFWQGFKIELGTEKEDYILQSEDIDRYFEQSYEFEAYAVQTIFYFNLIGTDFPKSGNDLRLLINKMFTELDVKYQYRLL